VVITYNGQPSVLMIDISVGDVLQTLEFYQKNKPSKSSSLTDNAKAWLQFADSIENCAEELPANFDDILNHRVNFNQEIDL
jgi:hypothetical protein